MGEKDIICRADIDPTQGGKVIIRLLLCLLFPLGYVVLGYTPGRKVSGIGLFDGERTDTYNLFGELLKQTYTYPSGREYVYNHPPYSTLGIGVAFVVLILIFALICIWKISLAKKCSLVLHDKGVSGQIGEEKIELPMSKVDNIFVKKSFWDACLCGKDGKTLVVCSASGEIKFRCVNNADEFMEKTLAEIQKWEDNSKISAPVAAAAPSGDVYESIQMLKNLLDQGLITQAEYDEKRRELVGKI